MRCFSNIMLNFAAILHLLVDSIPKADHSNECGKIRGKMQILEEKFVPLQTILNERDVTQSVKPARKG